MISTEPKIRRSILFIPANNQIAIDKARESKADVIVFDLKDPVPMDQKESARKMVFAALNDDTLKNKEKIVKINSLEGKFGRDDVETFAQSNTDGVLLDGVTDDKEINRAVTFMGNYSNSEDIPIWCKIKGIKSAHNIEIIARMSHRVRAIIVDSNSLRKDLKVTSNKNAFPLYHAIGNIVTTCRCYGLDVFDGLYLDIDNIAGFTKDCNLSYALGFDGKSIINPATIDIANQCFAKNVINSADNQKKHLKLDKNTNKNEGNNESEQQEESI